MKRNCENLLQFPFYKITPTLHNGRQVILIRYPLWRGSDLFLTYLTQYILPCIGAIILSRAGHLHCVLLYCPIYNIFKCFTKCWFRAMHANLSYLPKLLRISEISYIFYKWVIKCQNTTQCIWGSVRSKLCDLWGDVNL